MQLAALETAREIDDMDIPGFRLHPLKGRDSGRWSIRDDGNWRITIELTLRRFGDRGAGKRIVALGEHSWDRSTESLRDLWTKGKADLALPDIEPLVIEEEEDDEPEIRGVGGRTPS